MMMLVSRPEGVGSRYSYILYIQKIVKPVEKHDNGQTIPLQCHINENTIINFFVKLVTSHSHLCVLGLSLPMPVISPFFLFFLVEQLRYNPI